MLEQSYYDKADEIIGRHHALSLLFHFSQIILEII